MKRISEFSTKQTFLAILMVYFATAAVITMFCFLTGWQETVSVGKAFLYTGMIVSVLALLVLTQAGSDRKSGYDASRFMQDQDYQRKSIKADKPYKKVVSIVMFAAILLASTGYLLMLLPYNLPTF